MPLRCCILLLYKARERWAQDFEFIYLTGGQVLTFGRELRERALVAGLATG